MSPIISAMASTVTSRVRVWPSRLLRAIQRTRAKAIVATVIGVMVSSQASDAASPSATPAPLATSSSSAGSA